MIKRYQKPDPEMLTPREEEICELVSQGYQNKVIADKLFISEHTVKKHVSQILEKTQARNRTHLAHMWLKKDS